MRIISPCPCCGSKSVLVTTKEDFYENYAKFGGACVSIECTNRKECGITMFCHFDSNNYEAMVDEAVERFNRRSFNA